MIEGGYDLTTGFDTTTAPVAFLVLENIPTCLYKFHGILGPSPENNFIMQVRTCASSSSPQQAYFLMEFYLLSFLDVDLV